MSRKCVRWRLSVNHERRWHDPPTDLDPEIPQTYGWILRYEGKDPGNEVQFWGFNRYGNRWAVYQKGTTNKFAIVIRGTVLNSKVSKTMQRSVIQDALA